MVASSTPSAAGYTFTGLTSCEQWSTKAPMSTARFLPGGCSGASSTLSVEPSSVVSSLNTVEEYDPLANTWTTKAPMLTARAAGAATLGGKIYVVGGQAGGIPMNTVRGI